MKKQLLTFMLLLFSGAMVFGQTEEMVTFKFVPGDDMFYIPWGGNDAELNRLYNLVDQHRNEIASGKVPIYVDSYSSSMRNAERNRELAFTRANRMKSELITQKGLVEENFITKNFATSFTGADGTVHKDMVMVTLRIPARETPQPEPTPKPESKPVVKPEPKPEPKQEPVVEKQPEPVVAEPAKPAGPYCFAVRTNLLYDAFLLPTLGVEWRVNENVGVKLDGSYSFWGNEHGKVQKIWLVNPEARWYMGNIKRFYLGASANLGEYNVYKYMVGGLFSGDIGYQGKLWNAGLTAGYQFYLSRSFSLDLNLGLGYTKLEYDSFNMIQGVRVYKDRDKTKNFWGPTQAGVSVVWTIGGNK